MSSKIAEMRKKFEGGAAPTPENQAKRRKEEREKQLLAVKVARARAARYNMTKRSLALKAASKMGKQKAVDRQKMEEAKARAAKYNATKRGVQFQTRPTNKRAIDGLNKSLQQEVTPLIAQEVLEVHAIKNMDINELIGETQEETQETTKEEEEDNEEEKANFHLDNLEKAVKNKDEGGINRAILADFLEVHAPEELENLDAKLEEYKGREQVLFDLYTEQYPNPLDAKKEGEIKAQEEIAGENNEKVAENFVKSSDEEIEKQLEEEREKAYEETIKAAEDDEESKEKVLEEREKRRSLDDELVEVSKELEEQEDLDGDDTGGYILGGTLEKAKDEEDPEKWVVKVQPASLILNSKLSKLGLAEERANQINDKIEGSGEDVSEML